MQITDIRIRKIAKELDYKPNRAGESGRIRNF